MILSASEIKECIKSGKIAISPFDEANLKSASYTFTLGDKVRILKKVDFIDARSKEQEFEEHQIGEDGYMLNPGEFVVLRSRESLKLGASVACFLAVRGSIAQKGLNPISSAIFCEPGSKGGFDGPLSLETVNNGPYPIKLFPGIKIVKGIFQRL